MNDDVKLTLDELYAFARREGSLPETVRVGDTFKLMPMLMRNGQRMRRVFRREDHTHIRITAVPGGQRRRYSYVKVEPKAMGNGRADRGTHRCDLRMLAQHYSLERS